MGRMCNRVPPHGCYNCFYRDRDGLSCRRPLSEKLSKVSCWKSRVRSRNWRPFKKGSQTILE